MRVKCELKEIHIQIIVPWSDNSVSVLDCWAEAECQKVIHLDLKIKSSAIYVGTEFQSLMQFLCLV